MAKWTWPTGYSDPSSEWVNPERAYDNDESTFASWTGDITLGSQIPYIELTIDATSWNGFAFYASNGNFDKIAINAYYGGEWHEVYNRMYPANQWVPRLLDAAQTITKVRIWARAAVTDTNVTFKLYEFKILEATPPEITVPTVTVAAPADEKIGASGIYVTGTITDAGAENCDRFGICWNTGGDPTIADNYKEVSGNFGDATETEVAIYILEPATLYYIKAYAHNSEGYGYSAAREVTTRVGPPTSLRAAVVSNTQINLTWTKSENAEKTMVRWKKNGFPTSVTDGTQAYFDTAESYNHTGLDADETYYYRAWGYKTDAPDSGYSTSYAEVYANLAATITVPTVTTQAIGLIMENIATAKGGITSIGGQPCDLRGICWDTATAPTVADSVAEEGESGVYAFNTGSFTQRLIGLAPDTEYFVKAYAHNSAGYGYGNEMTFTTKAHAAATPVIQNPGFEAWASGDPVSWDETETVTQSDVSVHSGYYAAKAYTGGKLEQNLTWDNAYKSKQFTFRVHLVHAGAGSQTKVGIYDGVSTTWSLTLEGMQGGWYLLSITKTLAAGATELKVRIECVAGDADNACYYDDVSILMGAAPQPSEASKLIEFNGNVLAATGAVLTKLEADTFQTVQAFNVDITDLCVFKGKLYIAQGWSENFWYTEDLVNFTQCPSENSAAKYMANIGDAQFWAADSPNTLRASIDPSDAGNLFSTPYTLPATSYEITGLMNHEEIVFVRKQDQVYYLSAENVYPLIPELSGQINTAVYYPLYYWKGKLYIPSGQSSLYEYDNGVVTDISIIKIAEGHLSFDEHIAALAGDQEYLYAAVNDGDEVHILAGRWEAIDGATWVWHPIHTFEAGNATAMLISGIGGRYLYLGTDQPSDGILNFIVPYAYADVLHETGYAVVESGDFITPWLRSNFPTVVKYWKSIDITSVCITDKTSIAVYYQKKADISWTFLGYCDTNALVGGDYPPEVTTVLDIEASSERIRFKLVLETEDTDFSPILHGSGGGYITKARLLPERKKAIEATIVVAPTYLLRDETHEANDMNDLLGILRSLNEANSQVTVTGPDGEKEYRVLFDKEGYGEQLAYDEIERTENYWVTVKLLEV